MPRRLASGAKISSVSRAMRSRFSAGRWPSVRMLCSRSASLMTTTRTSSPMARNVLRSVSLASSLLRGRPRFGRPSCALTRGSCVSLVTPSTSRGDLGPELALRRSSSVRGCPRPCHARSPPTITGERRVQLRQDAGHRHAVGDIRLSRSAGLALMCLLGGGIGAPDQLPVGGDEVIRQDSEQAIELHRGRASRLSISAARRLIKRQAGTALSALHRFSACPTGGAVGAVPVHRPAAAARRNGCPHAASRPDDDPGEAGLPRVITSHAALRSFRRWACTAASCRG